MFSRAAASRAVQGAPPQAYFAGSALFHYLGPAFAVLLFARVDVLGVAWLRIASAGLVLAVWRRPWRSLPKVDRETWRLLIALGAVLAVMNSCFYLAIARLPLGTVAAIEFLPVIVLAALGARTRRNGLALALAVPGVYLLTDVRLEGEPAGVAFAFANAALFALYIVLAHRVARTSAIDGLDGLAAAMLIATVAITPIGGWGVAPALLDPVALAAGIGVGVSSSVIPYVCDQLAMARLSRATYSLMVSLLPATATVIGVVVLAQVPTPVEVAGVLLVGVAVAVHREAADGHGEGARALQRPDGDPRVVQNEAEFVVDQLVPVVESRRLVVVAGLRTVVPQPGVALFQAFHAQVGCTHVGGGRLGALADLQRQAMQRKRVRAGRPLEVDVHAPGQVRRRPSVHSPPSQPVALESHLAPPRSRSPDNVGRARRPALVEDERVADRPRLVLLDTRRVPLEPVAVRPAAQEDDLEPFVSAEKAPRGGRRELDQRTRPRRAEAPVRPSPPAARRPPPPREARSRLP